MTNIVNLPEGMTLYRETLQPFGVAAMRRTGCYGIENHQLMERFKAWVRDQGLFNDTAVLLGIALDDSQTTDFENCRYDVCLIVGKDFSTSDTQISKREIPGGDYVIMQIPHTPEAVQKAWSKGLPYLMSKGYRLDFSRVIMERYEKELIDAGKCEICVPVLEN